MEVGLIILAASSLCVGAILAGAAGQKIDAPILLIFLLAGMLAGREGPGGLSIDATQTTLVWASAALAIILFEGGLRTKPEILRLGFGPGAVLAMGGTVATMLLVAPFAHFAFGLEWAAALLLGAIISSTDAAAVFALAGTGVKMPDRIAAALEVESGLNDPIAILLVIGFAQSLASGPLGADGWVFLFVAKLALGGAVGVAVGWSAPSFLNRVRLPEGLSPILTAGFGFMAFGIAETIGGSGFLAIYVAGLMIAMRAPVQAERVGGVMDGLAWLAQTGLFLILGLLITPSHLASVALPALGVALALIFIARPIAVWACLAWFDFDLRSMTFIAWTGLRGATPVFLGLLPITMGVANANLYLSAAATVVLLSLVIQGWTAPAVGGALNLSREAHGGADGVGGAIARLAAAACAVGAATWFAFAFAPPADLRHAYPETEEELRAALESPSTTPVTFPPDFAAVEPDARRALFVETLTAVIRLANDQIEADRERLAEFVDKRTASTRLTLAEEAELDAIARRYQLSYDDPLKLLSAIDVVPFRLAAAQAAQATGWGESQRAIETNAVFGLNLEDGYPDLLAAAMALTKLYASHPDFAGLRAARAEARKRGEIASAEDLVAHIGPFADDPDYPAQIARVLESRRLAPVP